MAAEEKPQSAKNKFFPSSESIKEVGALVAVIVGVTSVTALAVVTMALVTKENANIIIPLSTAAFGVISAVVGAYLGVKIGTDQSKELTKNIGQAHENLAVAVQKLGETSGKGSGK